MDNNDTITAYEKQRFYYKSYAELLYHLVKINCQIWLKPTCILNNFDLIRTIPLDDQVNFGWRYRRIDDTIYETRVNYPIYSDPLTNKNNLFFSIHIGDMKTFYKLDLKRFYMFEGVFKYIKTENNTRIWQKISDTYTFTRKNIIC